MWTVYSIRNFLSVAAALVLAGGCQHITNSPPETAGPPILQDEAMMLRDWPVKTASYANGAVEAGPLGFMYEPDSDLTDTQVALFAPILFVGQTLFLPVSYILHGPGESATYRGQSVPPTYTAVEPAAIQY